ncbi:MAG: hypothetical protein WDW38_005493 [Sanguina aurantia]
MNQSTCKSRLTTSPPAGKGIGLVATRDVSRGELLLVSEPLAVVFGPQGTVPTNGQLEQQLSSPQLTHNQRAWLQLLSCYEFAASPNSPRPRANDSSSGSSDGGGTALPGFPYQPTHDRLSGILQLLHGDVGILEEQAARQAHQHPEPPNPASEGCSSSSSSSSSIPPDGAVTSSPVPTNIPHPSEQPMLPRPQDIPGSALPPPSLSVGSGNTSPSALPHQALVKGLVQAAGTHNQHQRLPPQPPLDTDTLQALVSANCYGEPSEDVAVAELRDIAPESYLGVWPEFSLANHSCSANTSHVIVGGRLLLHASRSISEGQEITTCYLGTQRLSHVAERRDALRLRYGFLCGCSRCSLEQGIFPTRRYKTSSGSSSSSSSSGPGATRAAATAADGASGPGLLRHGSPAGLSVGMELGGVTPVEEMPSQREEARRSLIQASLDWVFGRGRFTTSAARDNTLLMRMNETLEGELRGAMQEALTSIRNPAARQAALLTRLTSLLSDLRSEIQDLQPALLPRGQRLMQASIYNLYALTEELADLSGASASPGHRLAPLDTAPASDSPNSDSPEGGSPLDDSKLYRSKHPQDRQGKQGEADGEDREGASLAEQLLALQLEGVQALEAVAAGSDLHLCAALRYATRAAALMGVGSAVARAAEMQAGQAHVVRYGSGLVQVPGLLRRVTGVRRKKLVSTSLSAHMAVLAWGLELEKDAR